MDEAELLKLIKKAAVQHTREIDLSSNNLTSLPMEVGQLTSLTHLDLNFNHLTTFPTVITQLNYLVKLVLSGNQLATLPADIWQLNRLRELFLSSNQLTTLPPEVGQLPNLRGLYLSNNLLTELPLEIGHLFNLRRLYLSNNQLANLPCEFGQLTKLRELFLGSNYLVSLPVEIGQLVNLNELDISNNHLTVLPPGIGQITNLTRLDLSNNQLTNLPVEINQLYNLRYFNISSNELSILPKEMGQLSNLTVLDLSYNLLTDLPPTIALLPKLIRLQLDDNPLNPELATAYRHGLEAVKAYLRAKASAQITLNEAKLILVGEGEVGKSCLLGALRNDAWEEGRPTTHGIEIKPVFVIDPVSHKKITLNGWDFGGQRVYRPTHQLFFSAPAVYLVVWKPREGPQQGFVKEWIRLIKHREPEAKILVVATHGGPQQRQPDIDRQELWDLFGKDTVIDFFHVESKPDEKGDRLGIPELERSIARVAAKLPEMGRAVPKRWQKVRETLAQSGEAYLPLSDVIEICLSHKMELDEAQLFVTIEHRLGHLIHYQHDPTLRDIVVLKPDWLATAISLVLDDPETRAAHGLVRFSHLGHLWDDPARTAELRYPNALHPIFLRLMERFDLSYRVAGLSSRYEADPQSLIAQLVPDNRPERDLAREWTPSPALGDIQQVQICRIVDDKGQSASAEGLFYQLIVRLHRYSTGREDYRKSIHWQRGLLLDDDYNGRALLEYVANDVRITVRAPYPERLLAMLTEEVKYLVESFWEGLRCDVTVPCLNSVPCIGLFEVRKLIENLKRGRPEQPCPICNEWQPIDQLLHNAPAAQPAATALIFAEFAEVKAELAQVRQQISYVGDRTMGRFDRLDERTRRTLSRVDKTYTDLLQVFTDEAKEGPRLFSLVPVDRSKFNPKQWISAKFRLTLWCEHSKLPLPALNDKDNKKGVYEFELTREWFKKAAPYLKLVTGTLSLVLPVAATGIKLVMDETAYKTMEDQLDFGKEVIDASLEAGEQALAWTGKGDSTSLELITGMHAQGAMLRELHVLLKAKDPSFGGLVRVMNKRQEFLWVHEQFEQEY